MLNFIIKKLLKRKKESQRGATAVEFAIVILIFITIVFGIIEFGLLMYNQHLVTNAAREGARSGVMFNSGLTENQVKNIVQNYGEEYLITFGNKNFNVSVLPSTICEERRGDPLTIQLSYRYDFFFLPFQTEIASETTMRCE